MEIDDEWAFNCPQYGNLAAAAIADDEDTLDCYFDFDHENGGIPVDQQRASVPNVRQDTATPDRAVKRVTRSTPLPAGQAPTAVVAPQRVPPSRTPTAEEPPKEQTPTSSRVTRSASSKRSTPAASDAGEKRKAVPSNLCTNLEEWRKRTAALRQKGSAQEPKPKEEKLQANKRQHRALERSQTMVKRARPAVPERGRSQQREAGGIQRSSSFSNLKTRSMERNQAGPGSHGTSTERPQPHKRTGSSGLARERTPSGSSDKGKLTIPTTPTCLKRKPVKLIQQLPVKSSEDLAMDKIDYYRQALAKKRKQAKESCKVALSARGPAPLVTKKEPTRPHSFQFETDSRVKSHPMDTRKDNEEKDFVRTLRSDRSKSPATAAPRITRPKPFHFAPDRKRDEVHGEKYESMAERLKNFTATPDRYKSRPKEDTSRKRSPPREGITVPKTPKFETRTRARPVTAPSREDLENRELEEIQKHQFKAKPVNQKIMSNPNYGVRQVPSKPVTVPEGFQLSADRRVPQGDNSAEQEEAYEFHAQPLNRRILEGRVGVQEAKRLPITMPESPAFALKHRVRVPVDPQPQEEKHQRRSQAMPHFGVPFKPQLDHKVTDPEPFHFEDRDREREAQKRKKIEQVYDEENKQREFHANPLPNPDVTNMPPRRKRPLTIQQPFNLESDVRGVKKAEEWSHKMEDELKQQKEMARFRARSPHVLEQEPFVPQKVTKYTDISDFELSTAKRAVQREVFETHKKAKQDEVDNLRHQDMAIRLQQEREESERQRRDAVHKAQPVKNYKPLIVHRSEKPLTAPLSPCFKTDTRLRTRAQSMQQLETII